MLLLVECMNFRKRLKNASRATSHSPLYKPIVGTMIDGCMTFFMNSSSAWCIHDGRQGAPSPAVKCMALRKGNKFTASLRGFRQADIQCQ
jgi:hypothetical protein